MSKYLDEALTEYAHTDIYPFHMPGHKRRPLGSCAPEEIDITEVEGFDDLHHPEGILREGQERLARVFGADESFYLVNGSTAGNLAALCGCLEKGGRILVASNCHKSVYDAAFLMEARVEELTPAKADEVFRMPGAIDPTQVEAALWRFPDAQAVVITSPTYDGVVSDIRVIAEVVHARGIPLIVDAAHGAHFGFSDGFPQKAIAMGADLSVESLHKTLPAYTQTAALHLKKTAGVDREAAKGEEARCPGSAAEYRFDAERVRRYLDLFQSTSPSYVLMAGIDRCVRLVAEDAARYRDPGTRAESRFYRFEEQLAQFYRDCGALTHVRVCPADGITRDPSRILIAASALGLSGPQLQDLLLKTYRLQMERASETYVLALTTIMDTDEGFARLTRALAEIDRA